MKLKIFSLLLLIIPVVVVLGMQGKQGFDRAGFYSVMASDNKDSVNAQLKVLSKSTVKDKEAFEGVLLMKKAGLVSGPAKKLKLFKSGHKKLESSISQESKNAELRFFRLMIQEHAPGILNYNSNIEEDSELIRSNFKSLSQVIQRAVVDYTKKSKVLKPEFFN